MMRSLLILILFTLLSCENNFESIQDISLKRKFPYGITKNLKLTYTDSAMVKAILYSDLNLDYTHQLFPYSEFPEGIKLILLDDDQQKTIIQSDYAITYNQTKIVNMQGNVVIDGPDGSQLKTDQLYWDPELEWLFTEKKFNFKNIDYDISASRLDANKSFSLFNTGKLEGNVTFEDK